MKPARRGRIRNIGSMNTAGRGRVESHLQELRQVGTYQIAALVQAECIAPPAVAVKLFLPFHHVCLAAVFLDEPADAIATFAGAFGAQSTSSLPSMSPKMR